MLEADAIKLLSKGLIVNKENEIAINLYKKFDFKIVNEFDDENDKTAYLMSKQ